MTIQPIGAASVALYITPADLKEHGFTPAQLTLEQALELTQSAFREHGMVLEGAIEIEAYPDACGVLVFARIQKPERIWLSFEDCEDLLSAARALPEACPRSALTWCDGKWWISLPVENEAEACLLSEFGRTERHTPLLEAHLLEYGRTILPEDALRTLVGYFSSQILNLNL